MNLSEREIRRQQLNTFGDYIRKRRLDLKLYQKQVAERIGVSEASILNWESNATSPQVHDMPRIIEFLGYNPLPEPVSEPEKLVAARKVLGLTQKAMAQKLGVDLTTLARLERGKSRRTFSKTRKKLAAVSS